MRFLFILFLLLVWMLPAPCSSKPIPHPFPFEIVDAFDVIPDSHGFVVIRGYEEDIQIQGSSFPKSVALKAVDKLGVSDAGRSYRAPTGAFGHSGVKSARFTYHSWGESLKLEDVIVGRQGAIGTIQLRQKWDESNGIDGNSHAWSSTGECFGAPFRGEWDSSYNWGSRHGSRTGEYWTMIARDAGGGLSHVALYREYFSGELGELFGTPGYIFHDMKWVPSTPAPISMRVSSGKNELREFAGGLSRHAGAQAIAVGKVNDVDTCIEIGGSAPARGPLPGLPPDSTLLSATQSADGEIAVTLVDAGVLQVWSSTTGTAPISISFAPQTAISWFDDDGNLHVYTAAVPVADGCPMHLFRSAAGTWRTTELYRLAGDGAVVRTALDMTRMINLRAGLHVRFSDHEEIRLLEFVPETGWSSTLLTASPPGSTFGKVRVGGIADDDYLIVYQQVSTSTSPAETKWMMALESGPLVPMGPSGWVLTRAMRAGDPSEGSILQ